MLRVLGCVNPLCPILRGHLIIWSRSQALYYNRNAPMKSILLFVTVNVAVLAMITVIVDGFAAGCSVCS
jgi:hypothetical protein